MITVEGDVNYSDMFIPRYTNGDEMREALPSLPVGAYVYYRGSLHKVIDTPWGKRIATFQEPT